MASVEGVRSFMESYGIAIHSYKQLARGGIF